MNKNKKNKQKFSLVESMPAKQELALMCLCVSQGFETLDEFIDTMTENDRLINLEACALLCKQFNEKELKEKIQLHLKK